MDWEVEGKEDMDMATPVALVEAAVEEEEQESATELNNCSISKGSTSMGCWTTIPSNRLCDRTSLHSRDQPGLVG